MTIIVSVVNGTYTCPEHPDVGPITIGYYGDTPPAAVSVAHDENGNHVATPVDTETPAGEESAAADPAGEGEGGDGGGGAETQPADGSPETTQDGGDGAASA